MIKQTKKLIEQGGSRLVVLPDYVVHDWPQEVDMEMDSDVIVIRPHKNGDPKPEA